VLDPVKIIWDDAAIKLWADTGTQPQAALDLLAGTAVTTMKELCPVSAVQPVYASPVPVGSSQGQVYRGRGLARKSGPSVSRTRYVGDLPPHPSGYLRSSIHAFRLGDGAIIVGPTADYSEFVNNDTRPHEIRSHGSWPLRNRATGQVFGPVVQHPGTTGYHFIEKTAASLNGLTVHV
jgi:hypothetical protein